MIIINSLTEMKPYYNKQLNTYVFNEDVKFTFNLNIKSHIDAWDIEALNIKAFNIHALDIKALNIKSLDINASDITALNIVARSIACLDLIAEDINTKTVDAESISARDITYNTSCQAYRKIECRSISGTSSIAEQHVKYSKIRLISEKSAEQLLRRECLINDYC